uniref:Uncharacterized protein n=1 Tax=Globodera rostochiensis TaxID=31243 RepID=A0A914HKR4_GLORO
MGKQKQRFALRQAQDKKPLIQQNKLAKGKNIASSSKQSDERKPKISMPRKYSKNSSKPDKSVPSKEDSSKNEDLETQEMLEDPRAFLLKNLHLNLQKIPNTENENVNNIISESLKQYEINQEKFVESMEKILQTSSKDFAVVHQINQFKMDIDLKIESLKSIDELTPIQLFATREWLHLMKKDLDYMLRSLSARKNLMVAASKVN